MSSRRKQPREERKLKVTESSFSIDPRKWGILAGFGLCGLALLAYWNSFEAGFVLDNAPIILTAPQVHEATRHNIGLILQHSYWWPQFEVGLYRPVTTLSYLFNYAVLGNGEQPAGYHWINLLLHAGNVVLAYLLASRLLREFWTAALTASVWAVHPVLTEAVTNIVGRADLLATMATLSGLLMYLKAAESDGRRRMTWLAGLTMVTTVGVFSKESAVAILGVLILHELTWWKERRHHFTFLWGCLGVLLPTAAMLYQRTHVLAHLRLMPFVFTDNPILGAGFWQGRLTALSAIPRYVLLILWPGTLSSDYSYAEIPLARGSFTDWISWVAVGAMVVGVGLLYRRNRAAFFFACFAAATFAPGSNLLVLTGTIMAERLVYLPSLGVLACLVMAIYAAARRFEIPSAAPLILGLIVVSLLIRTWSRNGDWQSDLTLFRSAAQASPHSYKAHHFYARWAFNADPNLSHLEHGLTASNIANLNLVIAEEEKSLAILNPLPDLLNVADPYLSAAEYYMIKGNYLRQHSGPEATAAYRRGLQVALRALPLANAERKARNLREQTAADHGVSPSFDKDPEAYEFLFLFYLRTGDLERAVETGRVARELSPLNPEIHSQLAEALTGLGRRDEAAIALAEGIIITSNPGLHQELIDFYRKADPKGCEVLQGPNGIQINASCDVVRKNFCAASSDALKVTLQAGRRDLAENQERSLLRDYHCQPSP